MVKRAITGGSANYNTTPHALTSPGAPTSGTPRNQLVMANSNHFYGANESKNHPGGLNWPLMASQGPASIQSHLNWSNSFNSSQMGNVSSLNSGSNTASNSSLQNVWSNNNNVYGGPGHPKQRSPMCAQSNVPVANKKLMYGGEGQQAVLPANSSPSKYRRNPVMGNFKNMAGNMTAPTSVYELGSAGSDNTSSSSDSANLRENGLLYLQVSSLTHFSHLFLSFFNY